MTATVTLLLLALGIVYLAAELFTNALEHIGERLGVSEGVTGSVFAAVGTAMPETIVPLVAILAGGAAESVNRDVGLGAILGAPFMLGTLSLGLMAFFAGRKRGWYALFTPESVGLNRDLRVFMLAFSLVIGAALLPESWESARIAFATALFMTYFLYLLKTIQASRALVADGHTTEADSPLYVSRLIGDAMPAVVLQLLCGLVLLVLGARMFVYGVQQASVLFGVSALAIALLVVPVATELPEKVNSILWIRRGRDTLAFGNITGAMVFQSTIIPAAGMLLMPWHFNDIHAALAVMFAVLGASWLWLISRVGWFRPWALMFNAGLYLLFVAVVMLY